MLPMQCSFYLSVLYCISVVFQSCWDNGEYLAVGALSADLVITDTDANSSAIITSIVNIILDIILNIINIERLSK